MTDRFYNGVSQPTARILRAAVEAIEAAPLRKFGEEPTTEDPLDVAVRFGLKLRSLPAEELWNADCVLIDLLESRGLGEAFVRRELEKARASAPSADPEAAASDAPSLEDVVKAVRSYLDVQPGEEMFVVGALAVAVSKALTDEEPLWLMLIGPPSSGKTEAIRLLDLLADLRVDELTRAGLLSWSTS